MIYADILIDVKTSQQDYFTYSTPAKILPYLNLGSVVEVEFNHQKKIGIVINLKKQLKDIERSKIKPISRVIDSKPIIDKNRLDTATWASQYYFSSLGKVVFSLIPEPARREGVEKFVRYKNNIDRKRLNQIYLLNDIFTSRVKKYNILIKKTLAGNGQVIILVPNINSKKTNYLTDKISDFQIYHSGLSRTKKYNLWQKGISSKINLLLGTRQALFMPLPKLKLIIIDQPSQNLYKNQQEPFLDYRNLAIELARRTGANLVFADRLPLIKHYIHTNSKPNWKSISSGKLNKRITRTTIVNLNKEKSLISQPLERELGKALNNKQKSLLYLNRKGRYNIAICLDCQKSHYLIEGNRKKFCQVCGSSNIKYASLGIRGLAEKVKKTFSQAKIGLLSSQESGGVDIDIDKDIIISTSAINNYPVKFDLVSLILPDIGLNLPSYNSSENSFYNLYKTLTLSKKKSIIQTFNPEDPIFKSLANLNYRQFYQNLGRKRKEDNMPPFSKLCRVYSRKKPYRQNLAKARKVLINLTKKNPKLDSSIINISDTIDPIFFKWPYFLIKYKKNVEIDFRQIFAQKDSYLKIERDPLDLI